MKRTIAYITSDGRTFPNRPSAQKHEIATLRRQRVGDCLKKLLKNPDTKASIPISRVIDLLSEHASEFTDALSARAAARSARLKAPCPPRTES
jgi:hypothetical protein